MGHVSERLKQIAPSATLAISEKVAELRAAGKHVHDLGLGEADYPTPEVVTRGLHKVEASGVSRYTEVQGTKELREAVSKALATCFHMPPPSKNSRVHTCGNDPTYDPDEVIVSAGSKFLLYSAVLATCDQDDEVILLAPYWVSYPDLVRLAGARPVVVQSTREEGFIPPIERIARAVNDRTRLIFVNSPANPTGQVWSQGQLKALSDLVLSHDDLYLVSDEIYGLIVFGKNMHYSPASFSEEMRRRTILTSGLSKAYSMGGWRIGFAAVADEQIRAAMLRIAANTISSVPSVTQDASVHAFKAWKRVAKMRADFERRAAVMDRRLNGMGLNALAPKGAFYVFADVSSLFGAAVNGRSLQSAGDVSMAILEEANVASVAGEEFGNDSHIRLAFVRPVPELERACDALEAFVSRFRNR